VIPVAIGELFDKITILEIKAKRITDPTKLLNIHAELNLLLDVRNRHGMSSSALKVLIKKLKKTNETLWAIENEIRRCERRRDFGPRFIKLARGVYRNNDLRFALKREINETVGFCDYRGEILFQPLSSTAGEPRLLRRCYVSSCGHTSPLTMGGAQRPCPLLTQRRL